MTRNSDHQPLGSPGEGSKQSCGRPDGRRHSAAVDSLTEFKQRIAPLKRDPIPDHLRVYDAIAAKDSEGARVAMTELIRLAIMDMPLKQRPRAPIAGQASRLAQYS